MVASKTLDTANDSGQAILKSLTRDQIIELLLADNAMRFGIAHDKEQECLEALRKGDGSAGDEDSSPFLQMLVTQKSTAVAAKKAHSAFKSYLDDIRAFDRTDHVVRVGTMFVYDCECLEPPCLELVIIIPPMIDHLSIQEFGDLLTEKLGISTSLASPDCPFLRSYWGKIIKEGPSKKIEGNEETVGVIKVL